MKLEPTDKVYLGNSNISDAGRGVFSSQNITAGELIESCPIIFLTEEVPPYQKS